jgi:hypothetical protein
VAAVVREGDGFREWDAEVGRTRDADGDLCDLDGVREPGAQMVVLRGDEDLALAGEAPPRSGVLDAVEIALEAEPVWIGFLEARAPTRSDGTCGPGRERRRELGLTFLTRVQRAADVGMRARVSPLHPRCRDGLGGVVLHVIEGTDGV